MANENASMILSLFDMDKVSSEHLILKSKVEVKVIDISYEEKQGQRFLINLSGPNAKKDAKRIVDALK